jgi:hypothetical protein
MAGVSLAATAIGTVVSAQQAQAQGQAQANQAAYQAAVARNNQVLSERAAEDAIQRGGVEESRSRMETARLIGRQRAALAASGQVVDTGSALNITADTAGLGELDAQTIRSNAEREAYNLRIQGSGFGSEATLREMSGRQALTDAKFNMAGTLLSGIGSGASSFSGGKLGTVADRWYNRL